MDENNLLPETEPKGSGKTKKVIFLIVICIIGGYIAWPQDKSIPNVTDTPLGLELASLQDSDAGNRNNPGRFDGVDQRNIALGAGGGDVEDKAVYEVGPPRIQGILVGYGTKTDSYGEYLIAFVQTPDKKGYEVDLRDVLQYNLRVPIWWQEGQQISVYGEFVNMYTIRARSIR